MGQEAPKHNLPSAFHPIPNTGFGRLEGSPKSTFQPSPTPTLVGLEGGRLLNPILASQLKDHCGDEGGTDLLQGVIGTAMNTLLSGLAKDSGKTTLVSHWAKAAGTGASWCGLGVAQFGTLWISEESPIHHEKRRKLLDIGDSVHYVCRPFPKGKPTPKAWEQLIKEVVEYLDSHQEIGCVVWDTLTNLSPVRDENSNAEVAAALLPLQQIQQVGVANLLIHHHGWGKERSRGASALPAFVDAVADYTPSRQGERCRNLEVKGRWEPMSITVELSRDQKQFTRVAEEIQPQRARKSKWDQVEAVLPKIPPGLTAEELFAVSHGALSLNTLQGKLSKVAQKRNWQRTGSGITGDPYRYWRK
jgi:hypothetical protein